MALLLAMYQKLRLIREKNQATLDLTKYSSKLDRVTKNIERVQKRYTSLFSQLESQAKLMQSNATVFYQNQLGLGANSVNPYDYTGLNGYIQQTSYAAIVKGAADGNGYKIYNKPATANETPTLNRTVHLTDAEFQAMWQENYQNGGIVPKRDAAGQVVQQADPNDASKKVTVYEGGWSADQVAAFNWAIQGAKMQQQQAQWQAQQKTQLYGNNISIWLEAQKAQLEAEQDAVLQPLSDQETMWELEKTQADAKLKRINAQIEAYDSLLSEESKNTAPTFGLR